MKKSPTKTKQTPSIKPLRTATCPALSGKSTLTYDLGQDPSKALHFRVTKNDGGGFFSPEWVAWKDIEPALAKSEPVTSICLRSLFKGKSVNASGYVLGCLAAEGLVQKIEGKSRLYEVTGKAPTATKPAKSTKRKEPATKPKK